MLTIDQLIGEGPGPDGLGENLTGGDLINGFIPERDVEFVPLTIIGPPHVGAPNEQLFEIYRDNRPIPADEIGMQGPFTWKKVASHSAGRVFPLNENFGPIGIDRTFPGRVPTGPSDSRYPSPFNPGMLPATHAGFSPVEIVDNPWTVYYTASPNVGWTPNSQ